MTTFIATIFAYLPMANALLRVDYALVANFCGWPSLDPFCSDSTHDQAFSRCLSYIGPSSRLDTAGRTK